MKIFIAADHAGFELKSTLLIELTKSGFTVEDCGAYTLDPEDDYPEFVRTVAQKVSENPEGHRGIVIGGSGQGEAIVANRLPNVRAAVYYGGSEEIITLSREHNDANILSLGARFLTPEDAVRLVKKWLETSFSGDPRHVRRIHHIDHA